MNLKNITLNTAELGHVQWEDVKKVQPSNNGFVFFVSYNTVTRSDIDGEETNVLIGNYIQTDFNHEPTYKELINWIISKEYPNGKENQLLRQGVHNPEDEEYLEYYYNVENIVNEVKALLD